MEIKIPMILSQPKAHKSLRVTSVQSPPPVQLVVMSSSARANLRSRHVASPRSQPAESVYPNSLAVVMKEMKDVALPNGTVEPALDEIETDYQCRLALRCTVGLQLLPFMIRVTSPIISHALNVSGQSLLTEASDH